MLRLPSPVDLLNASIATTGLSIQRGLRYGSHPRQVFDLFRPAATPPPLPVLVWFYGGAWQSGARADYMFAAATLARSGLLVAVPDYRLHPEIGYPAFLEDAAAAVAAVGRGAAAQGGDPRRIFVAGHSAGAYIAAMLALDARWLGAGRAALAGVVGLAGPYDFLPILGADIRAVFAPAGADLRLTQPINHAGATHPPMLLLHGGADRTCYPRNSLALAARLSAAGGQAEARLYPHIGHIGIVSALAPLLRHRCPVLADTTAFIRQVLAAAGPQSIDPAA